MFSIFRTNPKNKNPFPYLDELSIDSQKYLIIKLSNYEIDCKLTDQYGRTPLEAALNSFYRDLSLRPGLLALLIGRSNVILNDPVIHEKLESVLYLIHCSCSSPLFPVIFFGLVVHGFSSENLAEHLKKLPGVEACLAAAKTVKTLWPKIIKAPPDSDQQRILLNSVSEQAIAVLEVMKNPLYSERLNDDVKQYAGQFLQVLLAYPLQDQLRINKNKHSLLAEMRDVAHISSDSATEDSDSEQTPLLSC